MRRKADVSRNVVWPPHYSRDTPASFKGRSLFATERVLRALIALAQDRKSEGARSETRGRRGLAPLKWVRLASKAEANPRYSVNPLPLRRGVIAFHLVIQLEQTPCLQQ